MAPEISGALSWAGVATMLFLLFMGAYLAGYRDGRNDR
jgi:hypothetical protein